MQKTNWFGKIQLRFFHLYPNGKLTYYLVNTKTYQYDFSKVQGYFTFNTSTFVEKKKDKKFDKGIIINNVRDQLNKNQNVKLSQIKEDQQTKLNEHADGFEINDIDVWESQLKQVIQNKQETINIFKKSNSLKKKK